MPFINRFGMRVSIVLLAVWVSMPSSASTSDTPAAPTQTESPRLSSLMTADDFARAGLSKLTATELAALEQWFARFIEGRQARPPPSAGGVVETDRIEAKLASGFSGWSGDTEFALDNGQVWRQRIPGKFRYDGPAHPTVVISKNLLGFYVLKLQGAGRGIGVERIR